MKYQLWTGSSNISYIDAATMNDAVKIYHRVVIAGQVNVNYSRTVCVRKDEPNAPTLAFRLVATVKVSPLLDTIPNNRLNPKNHPQAD